MTTINQLRTQLLELPSADRAALARDLLLSLDGLAETSDVDSSWANEIQERSKLVVSGDFTASAWQTSITNLRQQLAEKRSS